MATGLARMRPPRPLLWALVVGLVLAVLAMHHLAAHHGAADLDADHHAGNAHDAEPAAGGDEGLTFTGFRVADLSAPGPGAHDLSVSSPAPTGASDDADAPAGTAPPASAADYAPGALDDVTMLCLAVLGGLAVAAVAVSVVRPVDGDTRGAPSGRPRDPELPSRAPPPSAPERLARLQVLRL